MYFEDYAPGRVFDLGTVSTGEDEIVEFARRYDPQSIHTDADAAVAGPFGGLIASGWHTASLVMRQIVTHYLDPESALVSPGVDELRWHKPLRPGDVLRVRAEVVEATVSRSKPDRGVVRSRMFALDAADEPVISFVGTNFILRRP